MFISKKLPIIAIASIIVTDCSTTGTSSSVKTNHTVQQVSTGNTDYVVIDQALFNKRFNQLFDEAVNLELKKQGYPQML